MSTLDGVVRLRLSSTLSVVVGTGALAGRALGSRKARTLLALLAAARGAPVPTDRIVEALWHDEPPADPAANVATLVSRLRRTVGPDLDDALADQDAEMIEQSIRDHEAEIAENFDAGIMPVFDCDIIPQENLKDLINYLLESVDSKNTADDLPDECAA